VVEVGRLPVGALRRSDHSLARTEGIVAALQTKKVGVHFAGLRALDQVDLALEEGAILGLVGPNGAGKTTLVNVMSGFQPPSRGELFLAGSAITGFPPERLARLGIARTFQSVRLFRRLSVIENVEVAALSHVPHRRGARESTREALAFIGLEPLMHRRAGALAYADERRVGIARALALRPRFLLLDEPAAGMTEPECDELARVIALIPERFGCGVLLIEHNIAVVTAVCRDLHVLDNGRTLASGPVAAVRNLPEVIDAYFGTV
jgi:branched-chain amino acid transport system ATP-binding protein